MRGSLLLLVGLFVLWQPIGGVVWDAPEGAARTTVITFYMLGWALLLYATFLIDHFDLFGLKQVWRALLDKPYEAPKFHTPSLYKVVRHPLYIGWLMIFWFAPTMTKTAFRPRAASSGITRSANQATASTFGR